MALIQKEQQIARREVGAAILLGPSTAHLLGIALIGKLRSLGYSRDAESAADLTGADICAASGYNPWGLVWLFQDFDAADPAGPADSSDHPDNPHRVEGAHFENPTTFESFNVDSKSARAFVVPKNAAEAFLALRNGGRLRSTTELATSSRQSPCSRPRRPSSLRENDHHRVRRRCSVPDRADDRAR